MQNKCYWPYVLNLAGFFLICLSKRKANNIYFAIRFLFINVGEIPRSSVYQRLKELESRILDLEGLSPEYFDAATVCIRDFICNNKGIKVPCSSNL